MAEEAVSKKGQGWKDVRSRGEEGSGEAEDNGEIEDFDLGHDKKHHLIEFRVRGKWMSVPFADIAQNAHTHRTTRDNRSDVASERCLDVCLNAKRRRQDYGSQNRHRTAC